MIVNPKTPPRKFIVDKKNLTLFDCATINLNENEQVTFVRPSKSEFDFVAKEWGFYATPSINGRLINQNLRAVLVFNTETGLRFILILEKGYESEFSDYLKSSSMIVELWLDEMKGFKKFE